MPLHNLSLEIKGLMAGLSVTLATLLLVFGGSALVRQQIGPIAAKPSVHHVAVANMAKPGRRVVGQDASQGNKVPVSLAAGQQVFADRCAMCHGAHAEGAFGPNLHNSDLSEVEITKTIKSGVKGKMPAFATKLSAAALKEVVTYIVSLKAPTLRRPASKNPA